MELYDAIDKQTVENTEEMTRRIEAESELQEVKALVAKLQVSLSETMARCQRSAAEAYEVRGCNFRIK